MKIKDLQTGEVHEYGTNCHDSLYVSQDGRTLTYYNLQNGDGSGVGDYRFVCDDEKVPAESETADAIHCEVYFNIGGWNHERPHGEWIKWNFKTFGAFGDWEYKCSKCEKVYGGEYNFCPNCGADMRKNEKKVQTPSCLTDPDRHAELLERYKEGGAE